MLYIYERGGVSQCCCLIPVPCWLGGDSASRERDRHLQAVLQELELNIGYETLKLMLHSKKRWNILVFPI